MAVAVLEEAQVEQIVERVIRRVLGEQRAPAPANAAADLTTEQAAAELGVTPKTVRRYAISGRLKGVRRRGEWRFPRSALEEFDAAPKELADDFVAALRLKR